ncbi:MAG TPA: hypothetical protein PLA68_00795 [Panacibacter sp.]|nr:hypothetical protein [Panacibacter sp.]
MKKVVFVSAILIGIYSCGNKKNIPDVSGITVQLQLQRFDKDFFAIDTNDAAAALTRLQKKYPSFLNDFLYNILAAPPQPDSALQKVKMFLHDYKPVYDSAQLVFPSTEKLQKEITAGLQFVQYYFPSYKVPDQVVTFIGPIEGYANVLTSAGLAVGLQLYLGKDFEVYHTEYINEVYPAYQSRRFEPQYIAVNCIKNIIDDIYPSANADLPLVYQMIEAGKRLYVLDKLLPGTADSLKTGYTQLQLDGCYENEAMIWNYFLQNNLLYSADPSAVRDYMNDGPKTDILGDGSPGFIGQFTGWQIVKKWMDLKTETTIQQLLQTPAKQIFEEARYKPK